MTHITTTLSPEQLEWIVREVVRRLQVSGGSTTTSQSAANATLVIVERLVTTETLRNKLAGVKQVNVIAKAVVTPAVVDELRDRNITLVRGTIS